ncbi:MAG: hypothetical protein U0637_00105 [Phycisphaerales bacterium]
MARSRCHLPDLLLKATKVDGVYTADPKKDKTATRYDSLTYAQAISKRLKVRLGIRDAAFVGRHGEAPRPVLRAGQIRATNVAATRRNTPLLVSCVPD